MFAPLPTGFLALRQAVSMLGKAELLAPSNLEDIGLRMRRLYASARDHNYLHLSRGAMRRLPYAIWIDGRPPLDQVEPALMKAYWERILPEALTHPHSAKRWLTPLFYTYCHWFQRAHPGFAVFAEAVRQQLERAQGPMGETLRDLQQRFNWFTPEKVGQQLGANLITQDRPLQEALSGLNLWSGFLGEPLAGEAFVGALRSSAVDRTNEVQVNRILHWSRLQAGLGIKESVPRYPEHRVLLADALLEPWLQNRPSETVKNQLLGYFIRHYGDPRLVDNVKHHYHWEGVSPATIATLKRWLVGDTLRGFMRILQVTADDIWKYRERFWMAYYDKGVIEEAWLVLGSQAAWRAQREFGKSVWAQYGKLSAGAASDQSVLLMRIGGIIFMEWSHNGSLRASREGDPQTPEMYLKSYSGSELREVYSLDFHNGINIKPQLIHSGSERGHWQRKARDFIANQTGVRLNDQAIIG